MEIDQKKLLKRLSDHNQGHRNDDDLQSGALSLSTGPLFHNLPMHICMHVSYTVTSLQICYQVGNLQSLTYSDSLVLKEPIGADILFKCMKVVCFPPCMYLL